MSTFAIKEGVVYKGDEEQGLVDDKGVFVPVEGLHHKRVAAIEKFLKDGSEEEESAQEQNPSDPNEPIPAPDRGDLDHNLIAYRQKNWSAERFNELYPKKRLEAAGYQG